MTDLPVIMTSAGAVPTPPADIRAALVAKVVATNPGYTDNLPGSLIEDICSTVVAALVVSNTAEVDTINSMSPFGANAFLLVELGKIYGVDQGLQTNTSVLVFFQGSPGFPVGKGFTVSDGTYQYICQDSTIIGQDGISDLVFAVATVAGAWAVPPGTVQQLITQPPDGVTLTVNNPAAGLPGDTAESESSYRAQVLQAGRAASQGMATYMKTLLGNVVGVQKRLVSVRQQIGGGWSILCGGGDPYQVANAIWKSLFDISTLVGSTIKVTAITNANPGRVTTDLNHGLTNGQTGVHIDGVTGMIGINGVSLTVTVLNPTQFTIGINTTLNGAYTGGGVVTPNARNIEVSIDDYPDTYSVTYINPPQQIVDLSVTWRTSSPNFVSEAAVSQLAVPALVNYVNSVTVAAPLNLYQMQTTFSEAVASILPANLITDLEFDVSINNIGVVAVGGIFSGDPESYFFTDASHVTTAQG